MGVLIDQDDATQEALRQRISETYETDIASLKGIVFIAEHGYSCYEEGEGEWFLMRSADGELLENEASHCSCYGFEGCWSPSHSSIDYLLSNHFRVPFGYANDGAETAEVKAWAAAQVDPCVVAGCQAITSPSSVHPTHQRRVMDTVIADHPPQDGRLWDCQCARCGSSCGYVDCYECGGDGYVEDDDCCCADTVECRVCDGRGGWPTCGSDEDWCNDHPAPGREAVEHGAIEWFVVGDDDISLESPPLQQSTWGGE